ncbi:MAG: hypothetical protein K0S58_1672 [Nitrospira sp.]|nr:hypothetical protein [Nitrospira sp.]
MQNLCELMLCEVVVSCGQRQCACVKAARRRHGLDIDSHSGRRLSNDMFELGWEKIIQ